MAKSQQLQDPFLNACRKERVEVNIFLVNGVKLQGRIESFDQFVIMLTSGRDSTQIVYKHAISTISPTRKINYQDSTTPQNEAE